MTTKQSPTDKLIRHLAHAAVGLTDDALADKGVDPRTLRAAVRIGLVFTATSALSMFTRYHLTNMGREEAVRRGFQLADARADFRVLLADKRVVSLPEARALAEVA